MNYNFDIDKIVNYLAPYRDTLPETYSWNVNINKLVPLQVLNIDELKEANTKTPYQKGIFIKEVVPPALNTFKKTNHAQFYELCYWVISDWGGIRGFKKENVPALVKTFFESEKPSFDRIPSASKVGSYLYPEKFIAYDSRLAYALNWAMLYTGASNVYFPIPSGRNTKLLSYDMNVLIKLRHSNIFKPSSLDALDHKQYINERDKQLYISKEDAYVVLIDLIKKINAKLHPGDGANKLYLTEILLFSIADKEIFRDITENVKINF